MKCSQEAHKNTETNKQTNEKTPNHHASTLATFYCHSVTVQYSQLRAMRDFRFVSIFSREFRSGKVVPNVWGGGGSTFNGIQCTISFFYVPDIVKPE